jgi:hypothetical protein
VDEYAVVDTTDREVQHGELYLIQQVGGIRTRTIIQITSSKYEIGGNGPPEMAWFTCALRGFRQIGRVHGGIPLFSGFSDGPYRGNVLRTRLVGRIVGAANTPLGKVLAPSAGYEDEAKGNEAFDEREYLDVLIASGHAPFLQKTGGRCSYFERMPEQPLTEAQHTAVNAVRLKFCEASHALERVKAECERRGLFAN